MWRISVILLLVIGSVKLIKACDTDKCFEGVDFDVENLPSEEELKIVCPKISKAFECADETVHACTGYRLDELAETSSNITAAKVAFLMVITQDMFESVCSEVSVTHRAYVESRQCYNQYFSTPKTKCLDEAKAAYRVYEATKGDTSKAKQSCVHLVYVLVCLSHEIQEECGETAKFLFETLMTKTLMWRHIDCGLEDVAEIKTTFLQTLELEGERKVFFENAFWELLK
ncbi:uncharacterized protein LOC118196855 [Stegodyphus dumicola]|uniref:uncharacterized protein LOC118196855 n=1 Tax=Stegodyphus dumicola TaxID=202533 RepID=UPI0015AB1455|nr:uncharacterized protein LOC118196855 [Stegodyphus dumicola]